MSSYITAQTAAKKNINRIQLRKRLDTDLLVCMY